MNHAQLDASSFEEERPRLGAVLLRSGRLSPERLAEALTNIAGTTERLGEAVVRLGWLTEEDVAKALAEQFGLVYMDPTLGKPDPAAVALLPEELARRHCALPIRFIDRETLLVAMTDPTDLEAIEEMRAAVGRKIRVAVAERSAIEYAATRADDPRPQPRPDPPLAVAEASPGELAPLVGRLVTAVEAIAEELRALRHLQEEGVETSGRASSEAAA